MDELGMDNGWREEEDGPRRRQNQEIAERMSREGLKGNQSLDSAHSLIALSDQILIGLIQRFEMRGRSVEFQNYFKAVEKFIVQLVGN